MSASSIRQKKSGDGTNDVMSSLKEVSFAPSPFKGNKRVTTSAKSLSDRCACCSFRRPPLHPFLNPALFDSGASLDFDQLNASMDPFDLHNTSDLFRTSSSMDEDDGKKKDGPPEKIPTVDDGWGEIDDDRKCSPIQRFPLDLYGIHFLQGDAFCYVDPGGKCHEVARLDAKREERQVSQAIEDASGNRIIPTFDFLTIESLRNYVTTPKGPVLLHISTHGCIGTGNTDAVLAFENETRIGVLRPVPMTDFVKWVERASQGGKIKVIFVASCHSKCLGQALANCGIQHVVCCQTKVLDEVALAFETAFYKYLFSVDKRFDIQGAFDIALFEITKRFGDLHGNKFCLLPHAPSGSDRHRVSIHIPQDIKQSCSKSKTPKLLPPPLNLYQCRPGKKVEIIEAMMKSSFIDVKGKAGVGKTEIVKEACHYLYDRLHYQSVKDKIEEIVWCPYLQQSNMSLPWLQGDHSHYHHIQKIFDAIRCDQVTVEEFKNSQGDAQCHISNLKRFLYNRKALLVVEAKALKCGDEEAKMAEFVTQVLSDANNTRILVIHNNDLDISPGTLSVPRRNISVGPMDFRATLKLFTKFLRLDMLSKEKHGVSTPEEFCEWLMTDDLEHALNCRVCTIRHELLGPAKNIYDKLGNGMPRNIIAAANDMTAHTLDEIVALRRDFDDPSQYQTRFELCQALQEARRRRLRAHLRNVFDEVEECNREIRRLIKLKDSLKSLPELDELRYEHELKAAQARFKKNWDDEALHRSQLRRIEKSIEKEKQAQRILVRGLEFLTIETRGELEYLISESEKNHAKAWEKRKWEHCTRMEEEIRVLEGMRQRFPCESQLKKKIKDLRKNMQEAKDQRNSHVGQVIHRHILAKELQLEREKEYTAKRRRLQSNRGPSRCFTKEMWWMRFVDKRKNQQEFSSPSECSPSCSYTSDSMTE